jgi:transcriptional regulator with XRE-family HTH domain
VAHITYTYKGRRVVIKSLAKKLKAKGIKGASHTNLTGVFRGRHNPSYELLLGIAEARSMTLDEVRDLLEHCRKQYAEFHDSPPFFE